MNPFTRVALSSARVFSFSCHSRQQKRVNLDFERILDARGMDDVAIESRLIVAGSNLNADWRFIAAKISLQRLLSAKPLAVLIGSIVAKIEVEFRQFFEVGVTTRMLF